MQVLRTALLICCVCAAHIVAQQDTITGRQYSRWYYTDGTDNTANCGHFTCTGNSRLNDPVNNSRIYVTMQTPLYNGTIINGSTVVVPSLQHLFSVSYTYNLTGFEEYSYTVHLQNLNASTVGFYYCRLGSAAPKRARPELLHPNTTITPMWNISSNSSDYTLKIWNISKTFPLITEVRIRIQNQNVSNGTFSTGGADTLDINFSKWRCEKVFLDYGVTFHSTYPCGYALGLVEIMVCPTATPWTSSSTNVSNTSGGITTTAIATTSSNTSMVGTKLRTVSIVILGVLLVAISVCLVYTVLTRNSRGDVGLAGYLVIGVIGVVAVACLVVLLVFLFDNMNEFNCKEVGYYLTSVDLALFCALTPLYLWMTIIQCCGRRFFCCGKVNNFETSRDAVPTSKGNGVKSSHNGKDLGSKGKKLAEEEVAMTEATRAARQNRPRSRHGEKRAEKQRAEKQRELDTPQFPDVSGHQQHRHLPPLNAEANHPPAYGRRLPPHSTDWSK